MRFSLEAAGLRADLLDDLKVLFEDHRGEREVELVVQTRGGERRLRFGPEYRVRDTRGLRAQFDDLIRSQALAA